jgi:alpha-ketoglutarate-dependent taurine dioxygenase
MSEAASNALKELEQSLRHEKGNSVVHLTPEILPKGSIILLDNRLWLHARNGINDPERHLRRVRWDASPFTSLSK